ncbi:MAG: amino acid adenylation domain-containing protein, partial [Chitinophagaceae bacterium]
KYTHQEEVIVGVSASSTAQLDANKVGNFTEIIPLRSQYADSLTLNDFFQAADDNIVNARAHSASLDEILSILNISNSEKHPTFKVSYAYKNINENVNYLPELKSLGIDSVDKILQQGNVDLGVDILENQNSFGVNIKFNPDLYSGETVTVLFNRYCALLNAMLQNSELPLHDYSIVSEQEKSRLLVDFNNTDADYAKDKCLHQLFVEQVRLTPEKIAVIYGNEQLTYQQLYEKSHTLAVFLQSKGVTPDSLIGVCTERSVDMLVGMLGILQAGGAYVPLDPEYPDDRLEYILQDSQAAIVLTQEKLKSKLNTFDIKNTLSIALDGQWPEIEKHVAELTAGGVSLQEKVTADHLAYIIYTSGSTGKPKGVAIEHHSPVTLVHWAKNVYSADELAGVLASTSICFDLSVYEIFLTLAVGGKIILAQNALALIDLPHKQSITLINTVPSAMEELVRLKAIPDSVKTINLAGEALLPTLVDKIYTNCSAQKVYDLYGPSEDTTYSTFTLREKNSPQTIGRPIANTQVYMLDKFNNPQPIGIPGELHIAGDGLARCYLNRPELTQEKFVTNPFNQGTRMYKTGDLARWLENGTIEYLGRIDTQIKIRGFRIETGEIETRLNQYQEIKESIVVAQGEGANKRLVAFYVANSTTADNIITLANEELKSYLHRIVPEFMVPAAFISLAAIPLTPNGKVNRRLLESMTVNFESSQAYEAPRNKHEKKLVNIWSHVLNIPAETVGVNDNFFELGGHSLLATQLISRIRSEFDANLSLKNIFEKSTVAEIAHLITHTDAINIPRILPVGKTEVDCLPLSFVQERLW